MNEATITSELFHWLREKTRGEVIKHADLSLIGMPDGSVTAGGTTQFLELKLVKVGARKRTFDLAKIVGFGGAQSRLMGRLDHHGAGAYYVIFFMEGPGKWRMQMTCARRVAELCALGTQLDLDWKQSDFTPDDYVIHEGKSFEYILEVLKKGMK
jgi:hypothetical protein